jgi:Rps23 Pro-64 3,4-dihydroxylase Tpa1-like proline 4-hydroxylase
MPSVDFERLERIAEERHPEFAAAAPYPHVVIDDFLPAATAEAVREEFDRTGDGWKHYNHYNERKLALTDVSLMLPHTRALFDALQSDRFVRIVERLTGIEGLLADPDLDGAGLHRCYSGGFLNLHTDFLSHTKNRHWSRQLNLLLYLNRDWPEAWNGSLELWDAELKSCVRKVAPVFNRCMIFHTCEGSYHGHPAPLACPEGESRRSIALYYFRDEGETRQLQSTYYRARPDDPFHKKLLVAADRTLLRAYSVLKRYTPLSDRVVSRILRRL